MGASALAALVAGVAIGLGVGLGGGIALATGGEPHASALPDRAGVEAAGGRTSLQQRFGGARRAAPDAWLAARSLLRDVRAERGESSLSGFVRTRSGKGIEGIEVTALLLGDPPVSPPFASGDDAACRDLLTQIAAYRWTRATTRTVRTGADGAWRIDGLVDGAFQVRAWNDDWEFDTGDEVLLPGATRDIVGTPLAPVTIEVEGGADEGRVELSVRIEWCCNFSTREWSRDDPVIRAEPGRWTIYASAGLHSERTSELVEFVVDETASPLTVHLVLREKVGVIVTPEASDEDAPSDLRLRLSSVLTDGDAHAETVSAEVGKSSAFLDVAPGTYVLTASSGVGGACATSEVTVGNGLQRITLPIPRKVGAEVEVCGIPPDPRISKVEVNARRDGRRIVWRDVRDGVAAFADLPEGEVEFEVELTAGQRSFVAAWARTVLRRGDNPVTLRLPALHDVRVTFDPAGDPPDLEWIAPHGDPREPLSEEEEDGTLAYFLAPAGEYLLSNDDGEMPARVTGPATIRFDPRPYDAIRLDVDAEDDAFGAGLRDEDLIVAIDGVAFRSRRHIDALLAASQLPASSVLGIVRDGRRIEVAVDMSKLGDGLDREYAVR